MESFETSAEVDVAMGQREIIQSHLKLPEFHLPSQLAGRFTLRFWQSPEYDFRNMIKGYRNENRGEILCQVAQRSGWPLEIGYFPVIYILCSSLFGPEFDFADFPGRDDLYLQEANHRDMYGFFIYEYDMSLSYLYELVDWLGMTNHIVGPYKRNYLAKAGKEYLSAPMQLIYCRHPLYVMDNDKRLPIFGWSIKRFFELYPKYRYNGMVSKYMLNNLDNDVPNSLLEAIVSERFYNQDKLLGGNDENLTSFNRSVWILNGTVKTRDGRFDVPDWPVLAPVIDRFEINNSTYRRTRDGLVFKKEGKTLVNKTAKSVSVYQPIPENEEYYWLDMKVSNDILHVHECDKLHNGVLCNTIYVHRHNVMNKTRMHEQFPNQCPKCSKDKKNFARDTKIAPWEL